MGIDLRLLPESGRIEMERLTYSHEILTCDRDSELFAKIDKLSDENGVDVIGRFSSFLAPNDDGESHYGETKEDAYGNPLKSVAAWKLAQVFNNHELYKGSRNMAIAGYLNATDPDARIILFWD